MAENVDTGEKIFLLAQSYMPAQDIRPYNFSYFIFLNLLKILLCVL